MSLGIQALARNTNLLVGTLVGTVGGPGTETVLYEIAAYTIATTVSGQSLVEASHSAGGHVPRHVSGLEARLCGEVAHAIGGMGREQANELAQRLYAIYEPDLNSKPIGRPFEEVYDVQNIEPTPEWQAIYEKVWAELVDMGLPLDRLL
jgi:methylamine--corrinoid protein Co-methyltransferase